MRAYRAHTTRSLKNSILEIGVLSNKTVFIGIASILVLQAIFIYAPFMNSIFGSAPLEPGQILMAAAAGTIILPVISFEKWLRKRKGA
ncbi:MAG: cation transporting ATPase C-terminal domain-containing protein [Actinobacteria bacterium]|nr:cation transporting ATPase C-terminal domain-containing protein [Actinomycetota bacterium]